MKKILYYITFTIITVCLSACEPTVQNIYGEYEFKLSGYVTKDQSQTVVLPNEAGTLYITYLNKGTMMLTFNTNDGCAYTTQGSINGNELEFNPFSRTISLSTKTQVSNILGVPIETTNIEHYNTEVYGTGTIYGETIHFNLQYSGSEFTGSKKIIGDNILMIANKK